ncbi:MAG TPA: terminase family protein [Acidimicrobiales bacterium]|nr:terminase family protein [Acidimicrobiales bacterium]
MAALTRQDVAAARADVGVFAELLVGAPLWEHQLDLARSTARVAAVCSGRQSGKTRCLAVMCLHTAFAGPERRVLIVSAGEAAAKDVLAEVSMLATSPLLAGSVVDDERHQVTLSNGSLIRAVPASPRQIRGLAVDLLVIDEAAFLDEAVWTAAKYATIARSGSKVVLSSTPWGRRDGWFSVAYRAGQRHEAGHESFTWPSTASPLVDTELLAMWRASSSEREFAREVEAKWVDAQGAFFSDDELAAAVADYELVAPEHADHLRGVAGIDWGLLRDSSAIVVLAENAGQLGDDWPERTFFVPWLHEAVATPYRTFLRHVVDVAKGYRLRRIASECNGVGQMPTTELARLLRFHHGKVVPITTTATSKEDGYGRLKMLLGQGRLALPRNPVLLAQLSALEYEQRDSGTLRIAVPERAGHDDVCMALMLAVSEADVASVPSTLSIEVAQGNVPTVAIGRPYRPPSEPPVPVVAEGEPRPADLGPIRLGPRFSESVRRNRRHYTPPGPR